jgi:hypothetical protein
MKITTAMLVSALAFGSTVVFAQNASGVKVVSANGNQVTINAVMSALPVKSTHESFRVNRGAALSSTLQNTIHARQLHAMPLQDRNALDAISVR